MTLAGCTGDEPSDSGSGGTGTGTQKQQQGGSANTETSTKPKLELLEHEWYEEEFSAGVEGTVVNNSDSEVSYVGVQVKFVNDEGTRIGESLDNTTELGGGTKWAFDAMFTGTEPEKVSDYNIEVSDSSF